MKNRRKVKPTRPQLKKLLRHNVQIDGHVQKITYDKGCHKKDEGRIALLTNVNVISADTQVKVKHVWIKIKNKDYIKPNWHIKRDGKVVTYIRKDRSFDYGLEFIS